MRVFPDFQDELMKIDPRLTIVANPNRTQIANIKIDGVDVCAIPAFEIRDDSDPAYTVEQPNGTYSKHRSRNEALSLVKHTIEQIKNPDNADAFFGRNGY